MLVKKKLLILLPCFIPSLFLTQVGISTSNPLATLHVDGAKDNPIVGDPTNEQKSNDFVITSLGYVGVGTVTPTQSLDTNGNIRLRGITESNNSSDNIMAVDNQGILKKTNLKYNNIPQSHLMTTPSITPNSSYTFNLINYNSEVAIINISTINGCSRRMSTTFVKSYDLLSSLGAQARNVVGVWSNIPSTGNSGSITFPGLESCGDGGNDTQFNFDINITESILRITNKGNIAREYTLRVLSNI